MWLKTQNLDYLCFKKSVSHKGSADRVPGCLITTSMYRTFRQNLGLLDLSHFHATNCCTQYGCVWDKGIEPGVCVHTVLQLEMQLKVCTPKQWEIRKFHVLNNYCWLDSFWRGGKLAFSVVWTLPLLLDIPLWIFHLYCDAALHTSANFSPVSNASQTMLDQTSKQGVLVCGGVLLPGLA